MKTLGLKPQIGMYVFYQGKKVLILKVTGVQSMVQLPETGEQILVDNENLSKIPKEPMVVVERQSISWLVATPEQRERALLWHKIIQEYLEIPPNQRTLAIAESIARPHGKSAQSLYVWLRHYDSTVDSLLPRRQIKTNVNYNPRVNSQVEKIIKEAIENAYSPKTKEERQIARWQRISVQAIYENIKSTCLSHQPSPLSVPSERTISRRIKQILGLKTLVTETVGKKAGSRYESFQGHFEEASFPNAIWQIDHTLLDVVIVDDKGRPIGRAWFTAVIDPYSRCVPGFRVSLDPPSFGMVGLVLTRAILPKKPWLEQIDPAINYPTPFYGRPRVIYCDNAKEFRSKALEEACQRYEIEINWRPTKKPNFGGHIERLMGTFATKLKVLPGAVLKPGKTPDDYAPEKYASYTLPDLEKWLAHEIFGIYHHEAHAGIGFETPLYRFEKGLRELTGAPEVISGLEAKKLQIFLMPSFEATVQRDGITQHYIVWKSDIFTRIIGHYGTGAGKSFRTRFYFDPANMKIIYFVNPFDTHGNFAQAIWQINQPGYSEWEVKEVQRKLKEQLQKSSSDAANQAAMFHALSEQRRIREKQADQSKDMRRALDRQKSDQKKRDSTQSLIDQPLLPKPIVEIDDDDVLQPSGRAVRR